VAWVGRWKFLKGWTKVWIATNGVTVFVQVVPSMVCVGPGGPTSKSRLTYYYNRVGRVAESSEQASQDHLVALMVLSGTSRCYGLGLTRADRIRIQHLV
jgi:hypothetical protein